MTGLTRDLANLSFHPIVEDLSKILSVKTQNEDKSFFRIMTTYYMAKMASMMRARILIPGEGLIPMNLYAINLAVSGSGKGRSINLLEDKIINMFREKFLQETFNIIADDTMNKIAVKRANKNHTDPDYEKSALQAEFEAAGPLPFSFDSGTSAAVKQMRHKLLLAGAGSMNMEIDEIGSNLLSNAEVLTDFLELYDMGKIKQKLVKNTRENQRLDELFGTTPANMLLFGTQLKLLDGGKVEEEFKSMLNTGFARRCLFGYSSFQSQLTKYSSKELYQMAINPQTQDLISHLSNKFAALAESANFACTIPMSETVTLEWLDYQIHCQERSQRYSEYEDMQRTEMAHRHFKTAKVAGIYAFIDNAPEVSMDHLYYAIALSEESGKGFDRIVQQESNYVKLANYICSINREVTHTDLMESLPFYKGSEYHRKEMLKLAITHGYKNNQIICQETTDGIEFLSGSSLPETNLDEILLSYSNRMARGYRASQVKFSDISKLCLSKGNQWCNHHFTAHSQFPTEGGYRESSHVIPGFNMLVIDVDGNISIEMAQLLMQEYTYYIHTTKRHTDAAHRFRLLLPTSHVLKLDQKDYRAFMSNVMSWLPFDCDTQTNQRSRKWQTYPGKSFTNTGVLLDVLQFIPKTTKAEEHNTRMNKLGSLTNLERWFINHIEDGNRNNMLIRYAYCLMDNGQDLHTIQTNVQALNSKIENPLSEAEVLRTVINSVSRKIQRK